MRPRSTTLPVALTLGLCCLMLSSCTNPREQIQKELDRQIAECKKADGDFAEIEFFDGSKEQILREACDKPIEQLILEDKVTAKAKMGPYEWHIAPHPDSGRWVAAGIDWREFEDARRIYEEEDPDADTIADGLTKLASAQEALPESAWIRRAQMELVLKHRKKTRGKKGNTESLDGLGERAETYYKGHMAWAKEAKEPAEAARARLMVIDYLKDYDSFLDMALESQGSADEHLENAAKLAEKEGRPEEAEKYRKELADRQAKREKERTELIERQKKLKARACKEATELSSQGIEDDALKDQIVAAKQSTKCLPDQ